MKHLASFARSPLGYIVNLLATLLVYAERIPGMYPVANWLGEKLIPACETLCARDGVQDDMLF